MYSLHYGIQNRITLPAAFKNNRTMCGYICYGGGFSFGGKNIAHLRNVPVCPEFLKPSFAQHLRGQLYWVCTSSENKIPVANPAPSLSCKYGSSKGFLVGSGPPTSRRCFVSLHQPGWLCCESTGTVFSSFSRYFMFIFYGEQNQKSSCSLPSLLALPH